MKRCLALFLMMVLLVGMLPGSASAGSRKYSDIAGPSADYMEVEPNNRENDADLLELNKWVGGTLQIGGSAADNTDMFCFRAKAGYEYNITLSLDNSWDDAYFYISVSFKPENRSTEFVEAVYGSASQSSYGLRISDFFDAVVYKPSRSGVYFFSLCALDTRTERKIPYKIRVTEKAAASGPNINDMWGCDNRVVVPDPGNWLPSYLKKTVKSSLGNGIILRYMPDSEFSYDGYNNLSFLPDGTKATELARQNGFSLIKTEDGQVGWVQSKHLS